MNYSISINNVAHLALKKKLLQSMTEMDWKADLATMSRSVSVLGAWLRRICLVLLYISSMD